MKWALLLLIASAPAHAETLVDSITRHDEADVARLRARLPDETARCALGVVYMFRDDLTRAAHYLEGCARARIAPDVGGWVRLAVKAIDERLRMSELAAVEVTTEPPGLLVMIDSVPDELFPTPSIVWLPAGTHGLIAGDVLTASTSVTVRARGAAAAHLVLELVHEDGRRIDPRLAVMRANDCTLYRKQHGMDLCPPLPIEEEVLAAIRRRAAMPLLRRPDLLKNILLSAEEL